MPKNYQEHAYTIDLLTQGDADLRGDELRDAAKYLRKQGEDNKLLRGFAKEIMEDWPYRPGYAGYDGGDDLQLLAIKYGLLGDINPRPIEPCGESCSCVGYYSPEEFAGGITCYRKTELLLGDPI